jgi:hypothetical protein
MNTEQQKDDQLWETAKARVGFRWSFMSYFFVNAFLVVIWYVSSGPGSYFWPVWCMMGWGIGVAFQYFRAYHGNTVSTTQQEYDKLKREQQRD